MKNRLLSTSWHIVGFPNENPCKIGFFSLSQGGTPENPSNSFASFVGDTLATILSVGPYILINFRLGKSRNSAK